MNSKIVRSLPLLLLIFLGFQCFTQGSYPHFEDFDDLVAGGYVAKQLGGYWTTWSMDPGGLEDAIVTDDNAHSTPNAFDGASETTDLIWQFGNEAIESGNWLYSHYMYIPEGFSGYFNIQSDPIPGVAWVIEFYFNQVGTGTFAHEGISANFSYTQNSWFWVGINFNLDNGLADIWFDNQLVYSFSTSNSIGGVNYWYNSTGVGTITYFDDVYFGVPSFPDPCFHFDDLEVGEYLVQQLGDPWYIDNSAPGTQDALVTDVQSFSPSNSFIIDPNVDIIFKLAQVPLATGAWLYHHWMYLNSGTTGYFNVQSEPTSYVAWVIEFYFNENGVGQALVDGEIFDFTFPQDQWFWVGVNIDLDSDLGEFQINEDIVVSFETMNTIGGIDYFGASETDGAYYDDVCFDEGYDIQPPILAPPENLVAGYASSIAIDIEWDPPGGEKNAVKTNQFTGMNDGTNVEKDPNSKTDPINSDYLFDLIFNYGPAGTAEAGIETDGLYIYTSIWNGTGNFLKYNQDGDFIEEFTIEGADECRDLAYDGTFFYGGAASNTIFEMDFNTQSMVSTFTGPAACRAIAYNEDDELFYCNNWSEDITLFDKAGTNLGAFPVGPVGGSYYGLAYDNVSGGTFLWGYAQVGTNSNELIKILLPSGTESGVTFDVSAVIDPGGSGIAGGLAIDGMFVPDVFSFIGCMQGVSLFGLELTTNPGLIGYNVYFEDEDLSWNFLDFTTETYYIHFYPGYNNSTCYYVTAVYEMGESESSNVDCALYVGYENNQLFQIRTYPNPASTAVQIIANQNIETVQIYNLAGQSMYMENAGTTMHTINVSEFNAGVYTILVKTSDQIHRDQLIIY